MYKIQTYSHTITNPRDNFNKDAFLIKENCFVVADGISSKGEYGAQAAQLAIQKMAQTNLEELASSKDLKSLLTNLSQEIRNFGGGTTFTSLLIKNDNLILAHTGDSECYLIHEKTGKIKEVTKPFTLAFERFLKGTLDRKDLKNTPYQSNVLTSYLGSRSSETKFQIEKFPLKNVNSIILCSDGANIVPSEEMRDLVLNPNLENPAKDIALLAEQLGSKDDITVIVAKFAPMVY
jgi:PPM family protein phosphatase